VYLYFLKYFYDNFISEATTACSATESLPLTTDTETIPGVIILQYSIRISLPLYLGQLSLAIKLGGGKWSTGLLGGG